MGKRKVLFVGEASYLKSGFGKIYRELLKRLHSYGTLEVAEFSSYSKISNPQSHEIPWKLYCNVPEDNDQQVVNIYNSDIIHQFGKWRFERVLLDFKPDFVFSIRDRWMDMFIHVSPLRPYFFQCLHPCYDSAPTADDWLEEYIQADAVFTYTDWALEGLRKEGGGLINLIRPIGTGVDLDNFKPSLNKRQFKENFGLSPNSNIIGFISRNQKRKLFPELILAFKRYLDICGEIGRLDLVKNSYLYFHTSYPDAGWNLPVFLKESGVSNKILFTYICQHCGEWFPALFQDAKTTCVHCKASSAILPNINKGLSEEQLADVVKLFDFYVQYAIAEGFGVAAVEAAAAGVPIAAVYHTGMRDPVDKLKGYPILTKKIFTELETHAERCYPDNEHLAQILCAHFTQSEQELRDQSIRTRQLTEKHYSWDERARFLEQFFLKQTLHGRQGKWDAPYKNINVNFQIPPNLSHKEFIDNIFYNVLQEPEKVNGFTAQSWLRGLNYDALFSSGQQIEGFNRDKIIQICKAKLQNQLVCERARCCLDKMDTPDFIAFANRKRS